MYSYARGPRAKRRLPPTSRDQITFSSDDDDDEMANENSVLDDPPIETKMDKVDWKNAGSDIVKLIVGNERKEFSIRKNFVCQASEVMKAAFCGEFQEGTTGVMTLVEDDPAVVETFIAYCYPNFDRQALKEQTLNSLLNLYIFADKYRCRNSLKNLAMDEIQDNMLAKSIMLNESLLRYIFDSTTSTQQTPIRRYAAAIIAFALHNLCDDTTIDLIHKDLLAVADLQMENLKYQRQVYLKSQGVCICTGVPRDYTHDPRKRAAAIDQPFSVCYFHVHEEGQNCYGSTVSSPPCPKHRPGSSAGSKTP